MFVSAAVLRRVQYPEQFTNSGGGAADAIVTVNGAVGRIYYNTKQILD